MIEPTEADIGRGVIYRAGDGRSETGVITSMNRDFVFVRYSSQHPTAGGQATERSHLEWETPDHV